MKVQDSMIAIAGFVILSVAIFSPQIRELLPPTVLAAVTSDEQSVRDYFSRSAVFDQMRFVGWGKSGDGYIEATYQVPDEDVRTDRFFIGNGRVEKVELVKLGR